MSIRTKIQSWIRVTKKCGEGYLLIKPGAMYNLASRSVSGTGYPHPKGGYRIVAAHGCWIHVPEGSFERIERTIVTTITDRVVQ